MNWGHKITLAFILFAAFILYMVVKAFQQDIDLVAPDYYAQEIAFQGKMQQQANLQDLGERVELTIRSNEIEIEFPSEITTGEIHFYHPSRSIFDKKMEIKLDESNKQLIERSELVLGSYRVKLTWTADGKEYFQQETIFLK
ncbi:MAG: FixH family protein [Cyclobacteriaceae bacterium]